VSLKISVMALYLRVRFFLVGDACGSQCCAKSEESE
jgi:hypothetical protein